MTMSIAFTADVTIPDDSDTDAYGEPTEPGYGYTREFGYWEPNWSRYDVVDDHVNDELIGTLAERVSYIRATAGDPTDLHMPDATTLNLHFADYSDTDHRTGREVFGVTAHITGDAAEIAALASAYGHHVPTEHTIRVRHITELSTFNDDDDVVDQIVSDAYDQSITGTIQALADHLYVNDVNDRYLPLSDESDCVFAGEPRSLACYAMSSEEPEEEVREILQVGTGESDMIGQAVTRIVAKLASEVAHGKFGRVTTHPTVPLSPRDDLTHYLAY